MRDESWLINRFYFIWQTYFPEVEKRNHVIARWKGKWRNKFGHIKKLKDNNTEIVINSLFTHNGAELDLLLIKNGKKIC